MVEEREITILVGAVVAEGHDSIAYADEIDGDQLSCDIGERTMNALYAHGLGKSFLRQVQAQELGVGNVNDAIIKRIKRDYGKARSFQKY